jgi:predicted short-subunit dehydrogenase-like oxidoreductase (DUF2520 family)
MVMQPRIAIVGAGNFGSAVAVSLARGGYVIEAIVVRPRNKLLNSVRRLAKEVGARVVSQLPDARAQLIWFCVPDSEIRHAATALAQTIPWKGRVAFHSSGALTSDELSVLRKQGASVASVHPMMTFVHGSRPPLTGVPFAIEGDRIAVRMARQIVRNLDGQAFPIRKSDKAAYHAWATFASPLLTALLATNERVAALAGVDRKSAKHRVLPILRQTLENYAASGADSAFSGPIIRGDVETIRQHLRVLDREPLARGVYTALARAALAYLPTKNRSALMQVVVARRR